MARAEELARDPSPRDRADERPLAPGGPVAGPVAVGATAPVAGPVAVGATAPVAALAERVRPTDLARDRRLPVLPALDDLLPSPGLRRGTTVAVGAQPGVAGATSLALALAAGASQAGSWVAAVGLGELGLVAASAMGVAFERFVVVADPGRDRAGWASVVAALVDGFDVVLVASGGEGAHPRPPGGMRPADARRLVARVRERGAVLVAVGGELPGERSPLRLTVTAARWDGLGAGWGHLRGRRVAVEVAGRGEAARGRRAELWLPGPGGVVAPVERVAEPIPLQAGRKARGAARRGRGGAVSGRPGVGPEVGA